MSMKAENLTAAANGQDSGATSSAVAREFRSFLSDIEDLVTATASLTGQDLVQARARLNERVASAKRSVGKMGGTIASQVRHSAKVTDRYVHEQPWQSIGIGAVAGLLAGLTLAYSMRGPAAP